MFYSSDIRQKEASGFSTAKRLADSQADNYQNHQCYDEEVRGVDEDPDEGVVLNDEEEDDEEFNDWGSQQIGSGRDDLEHSKQAPYHGADLMGN